MSFDQEMVDMYFQKICVIFGEMVVHGTFLFAIGILCFMSCNGETEFLRSSSVLMRAFFCT